MEESREGSLSDVEIHATELLDREALLHGQTELLQPKALDARHTAETSPGANAQRRPVPRPLSDPKAQVDEFSSTQETDRAPERTELFFASAHEHTSSDGPPSFDPPTFDPPALPSFPPPPVAPPPMAPSTRVAAHVPDEREPAIKPIPISSVQARPSVDELSPQRPAVPLSRPHIHVPPRPHTLFEPTPVRTAPAPAPAPAAAPGASRTENLAARPHTVLHAGAWTPPPPGPVKASAVPTLITLRGAIPVVPPPPRKVPVVSARFGASAQRPPRGPRPPRPPTALVMGLRPQSIVGVALGVATGFFLLALALRETRPPPPAPTVPVAVAPVVAAPAAPPVVVPEPAPPPVPAADGLEFAADALDDVDEPEDVQPGVDDEERARRRARRIDPRTVALRNVDEAPGLTMARSVREAMARGFRSGLDDSKALRIVDRGEPAGWNVQLILDRPEHAVTDDVKRVLVRCSLTADRTVGRAAPVSLQSAAEVVETEGRAARVQALEQAARACGRGLSDDFGALLARERDAARERADAKAEPRK